MLLRVRAIWQQEDENDHVRVYDEESGRLGFQLSNDEVRVFACMLVHTSVGSLLRVCGGGGGVCVHAHVPYFLELGPVVYYRLSERSATLYQGFCVNFC